MSTPHFSARFAHPTAGVVDAYKSSLADRNMERNDNGVYMYRAVVFAVDPYGGRLESPTANTGDFPVDVVDQDGTLIASYTMKPKIGPRNPPYSVRARILSPKMDVFIDDDHVRTYYPMNPSNGRDNPKPGEAVWVTFEDDNAQNGLWVSKIVDGDGRSNPNLFMLSSQARAAAERNRGSKTALFNPQNSREMVYTNRPGTAGVTFLHPSDRLRKLFVDR